MKRLLFSLLATLVLGVGLLVSAPGVSAHTLRIATQISLAEYRPGELSGDVRSKVPGCEGGRTVTVKDIATGETWGQGTTAGDGSFTVEGAHEPNRELRIVAGPKKLRDTDRHRHLCRKGFSAVQTSP